MKASAPAPAEDQRLRVLYVIDTLQRGGKERQTVELIKGLMGRHAVEPAIVCLGHRNEFAQETDRMGISVHQVPRSIRWDPAVLVRLRGVIASFRPHVVHTFCAMTTFYALPVCRLFGVKLVNGTIRSSHPFRGFRGWLDRMLLSASDLVVANSLAGLVSRGLAPDERKFFVVYNGFDFRRLRTVAASPSTAAFNPGAQKKVVGMVASFSDLKDYETFLRAALEVLARRNDVVFVAVGDGKNMDACRTIAEGNTDSIHFLGKRNDVEDIVARFNVGVLSTFTEGISNSVMEYMALGKPVVVTAGGGSSELVVHGETGFLVAPQSPSILAQNIEYLLDHPEAATKMGEAGRSRLERHFSLDTLAGRMIELYRFVLPLRRHQYGSAASRTSGASLRTRRPEPTRGDGGLP